MKIFVVSLKDCTNGVSSGKWLDISGMDSSSIQGVLDAFLAERSKATKMLHEEWAIHDYDGPLAKAMRRSEYPDLSALAAMLEGYKVHGDAWLAYCEATDDADRNIENFEESYSGNGDDPESWATEYLNETGEVKADSFVSRYFDYEAYVGDLAGNGWKFEVVKGTTYAFRPV